MSLRRPKLSTRKFSAWKKKKINEIISIKLMCPNLVCYTSTKVVHYISIYDSCICPKSTVTLLYLKCTMCSASLIHLSFSHRLALRTALRMVLSHTTFKQTNFQRFPTQNSVSICAPSSEIRVRPTQLTAIPVTRRMYKSQNSALSNIFNCCVRASLLGLRVSPSCLSDTLFYALSAM